MQYLCLLIISKIKDYDIDILTLRVTMVNIK